MKIQESTSVLILSHGYRKSYKAGGPPQDICNFLLKKAASIDYVVNPFPFADFNRSFLLEFKNGKIVKKNLSAKIWGTEWLQYIQHFFITFSFILRRRHHYDICFALDDLSLVSILIFKKIGLVKKLVYYSIDYTPKRFKNPILNYLYHLMDRISCYNSDINWVVAKHMINARRKNGVLLKKCSPFFEVPIGFHQKEIKIPDFSEVDKFHLVFVGFLAKKQGLQLAIGSLPKIISVFPKVHMTIIGTGDYEKTLKGLVKRFDLENKIKFRGFIENHREVEKVLTKAGIGIAPYRPESESFTYYADPGKIKLYLGCGLPIITTGVPFISKKIKNNGAGMVIDYDERAFRDAVRKIIGTDTTFSSYKKAAIKFAAEYDVEKILKRSIANIP